ncbi:MAG: carboxypeptidase-like regulatory domain-containing protein, partial [Mariprofundales bacterium]
GLGGANTDAAGIATISVPTATNVSAAVPTFLVSVWPGWNPNTGIQDTSFIGGVVDSSYSLISDWTSAANFATDLSDWPTTTALGNDANGTAVTGLLVTASAGATLGGTVSDSAGNPLPNIWVSANDNSFTTFFGTGGVTDSNGNYTMTLADGSYDISVWDPVYINPPVQSVNVKNGAITDQYAATVTAMNFTMGPGSTISGRVTDQSGAGLANMWVDLHTRDYTQFNGASTDVNGDFSVSVTPATNYVAVVYGWGPNGDRLYQDNFYNGGSDEASATTIDGSADKVNVNFVMKSGAAISGTIAGLASGDTVWLDISSESAGAWGNAQVTGSGTGSDTFTITGLASATDYRLNWWSDKYISGTYGGTLGTTTTAPVDWFAATMLDTSVGDVTGADITMSTGNTITLTVSGLQSGDSVDASAWSDSTANGGWGNATADSTGTAVVTVPSLAVQADYRLWVNAYSPTQDYKSGYYATSGLVNYDQATLVDVTAGSQAVTVAISQGGSVSGSVTGLAKGKSAWIDMWSDTTFAWGNTEVVGGGTGTDTFTIKGLDDASDFKMSIYAEGLIGGYYNGSGTALVSWQDAYSIAVVAGAPVTGVVMPLSAGKNISGSVTGLSSGEYGWLDAWSDSTFAWGGPSIDGPGSAVNYTISGLSAASDYTVNFSSGNYVTQSLTGIDVSAADYTSANFTASTGGSIGGSITGLAANEWVWVDASGSSAWGGIGVTADANGSATYKIPALADASDYVVSVWSSTVGYYAKDSYGNAAATTLWDSAAAVTVANSGDTTGIDIDFAVVKANTVSISGTVSVPGATNIAAEIIAWSDTGGWGMATRTGTGTYTIDGLAPGKYTISAWAFGCTELIVQIVNVDANGAVTSVTWGEGFASSGTLTVGTKNITGLDIQLSAGLKISGKITDQNGAAVPNVYVSAWNNSNMSGSGATTDANGNYEIDDLSGNKSSYDLEVKTPSQGTAKATVTLVAQDIVQDMQLFKANGIMSGVVTVGGQAKRGAMVYVYDANGKIVDSTVTDASGKFSLDDLDSATSYRVDVDTNGDAVIDSRQTSTPNALTFAL